MELTNFTLDFSSLTPEEVSAWNEAYETIESYFFALGLRNRLMLNSCIYRVLQASFQQVKTSGTQQAPTEVAMNEAMRLVADWFERVLDIKLPENRLAARGRLALYLGDLATRWQEHFLAEPPWPQHFVESMRKSYFIAGPAFQETTMTPRPIDLSPLVNSATEAWFGLDRVPKVKQVLRILLIALIIFLVTLIWS